MPASKDTRVRVLGLSKTSATIRDCSAREERGAAFSSPARRRIATRSSVRQLGAGEQMTGQAGKTTVRRRCAF